MASASSSSLDTLQAAYGHVQLGQLNEAAHLYATHIADLEENGKPICAEMYAKAAHLHAHTNVKCFETADQLYHKCMEAYKTTGAPVPPRIYASAASTCFELKDFNRASCFFTLYIQRMQDMKQPIPSNMYAYAGGVDLKLEKFKTAAHLLTSCITAYHEEKTTVPAAIYSLAADAQLGLQNFEEAHDLFMQSLTLYYLQDLRAPIKTHIDAAYVAFECHKYTECITASERAIAQLAGSTSNLLEQPSLPFYLASAAYLLTEHSKEKEMIRFSQAYLRSDKEMCGSILFKIATIYLEKGHIARGLQLVKKARRRFKKEGGIPQNIEEAFAKALMTGYSYPTDNLLKK